MTMMQRLSLLLLLVCVATTTAIETHMGKRYHPFDSPLSAYGNYQGQKDDDKKMVSNRRKADAIVDARLEKMKNIAMKKRAREIKREQGMKKDVFNSEEMEALFMYTDYM